MAERKSRRSSKTDEDLAISTPNSPEADNDDVPKREKKVKVKGALKKKSFSKISNRLLSAGAIKCSNLTSSKLITETMDTDKDTQEEKKGKKKRDKKAVSIVNADSAKSKYDPNAIEKAQSKSSLYDKSNNSIVAPSRKHTTQSIKAKTLGKGWFDIAPARLDIQTKRDMEVVKMRDILDPKRFYKRPDRGRTVIGTGTVIEGPTEYTSQRMNRKDRRTSITGEIMADKKVRDYTKRKYAEIQAAAAGTKKRPTRKPMGAREAWGSTKKNSNKKRKSA